MTKKKLKEAPEAERLPFTPEDAIERLREVLRMLESVTDDKGRVDARSPLPKARVYLRGIIGCGIADVRDQPEVSEARLRNQAENMIHAVFGQQDTGLRPVPLIVAGNACNTRPRATALWMSWNINWLRWYRGTMRGG